MAAVAAADTSAPAFSRSYASYAPGSLVPVRTRAFASACMLFIISLIGFGLGPLLIGAVSDLLEPAFGVRALGYAICLAILGDVFAVRFFLLAACNRAPTGRSVVHETRKGR